MTIISETFAAGSKVSAVARNSDRSKSDLSWRPGERNSTASLQFPRRCGRSPGASILCLAGYENQAVRTCGLVEVSLRRSTRPGPRKAQSPRTRLSCRPLSPSSPLRDMAAAALAWAQKSRLPTAKFEIMFGNRRGQAIDRHIRVT